MRYARTTHVHLGISVASVVLAVFLACGHAPSNNFAGASGARGGSAGSAGFGLGGAGSSAGGGVGGAALAGTAGTLMGGAAGASGTCPRHCGPRYEELFDNGKLATLRITFAESTLGGANWLDMLWQKWKHCPPHDNYVPVQMSYESPDGKGDVTLENVGMRLRGSMLRSVNDLQGFKLDFQALAGPAGPEGKRRFGDLNRLNTLSIEDDPSHLVQCLAYKALRDFGLPAPRCNHLMVYVNGAYYGLMEHAEQADNRGFLRRHFGANAGNLYAASPSAAACGWQDSLARLEYSGDTFTGAYTKAYQLVRATTAEAEQNLIPMLKCGDATATPDEATFKACISEWLDVDEWLRQIAAESLMPSLEAFIGYQRNYFLYFKPDSSAPRGGRFLVWSWDLDTSFVYQRCSPSSCNVNSAVSNLYKATRPKLVQRLTTVYKAEYCAALKRFLSDIYKPELVDDMANVIRPGMTAEPTVTLAAWESAVAQVRGYIVQHAADMQTAVATACN
ncbi:MAG: CotH kinase family protein [Myxococcota bacterium]